MYRPLEHCVEHRREITGRGIDDLQYLGGCGLLLQSLTRLGQEPRILHSDDRLRREVFEKSDLPLGKRENLEASGCDVAEQGVILAQWNHKQGTDTRFDRRPV